MTNQNVSQVELNVHVDAAKVVAHFQSEIIDRLLEGKEWDKWYSNYHQYLRENFFDSKSHSLVESAVILTALEKFRTTDVEGDGTQSLDELLSSTASSTYMSAVSQFFNVLLDRISMYYRLELQDAGSLRSLVWIALNAITTVIGVYGVNIHGECIYDNKL
jgi:hypothetical protein